jgi:hypothetical protein
MSPNDGVERREFRMLSYHFLNLAIDRPEIAERFTESFEQRVAEFASRLAKDADEGTIVRDPREAAQMIVLTMSGFGIVKRVVGAAVPVEEIVEMLYGYLTSAPTTAVAAGPPATLHGP